jgi:hypothetical protein
MEFVEMSFECLTEERDKKGKINKKIIGMPSWKNVTKSRINEDYTGRVVLTGKISGITVFDFDIEEVYYKFVDLYPDLKKYKTIKTKNGFHVYCHYDEDIKTTTDGFVHDKGVDIRNDGAMVFSPPCKRNCLDGSVFTYEDLGGEILPVPDIFVDNMKQLESSDTTEIAPYTLTDTNEKQIDIDSKCIKEAIEKGWLDDMANASYDEWRNVGFAIKHTLGDQGRELFHQFSQINDKYDDDYTNKFWDTIKQGKKPLTLGSIKYWVRQYKEKRKSNEKDLESEAFKKMAQEFEKNHAKIKNREMFICKDMNIITMSKKHLITAYEHLVYEYEYNDIKMSQNFIARWIKNNPTQRIYDDIGVYPDGLTCPSNIFNMWKSFDMEYVTEWENKLDELAVILNHIKILCNNDENVCDYFIKWIAQMIQFPAVKTICPTFISKEGAGKTTLIVLLEKMLGSSKVYETTNPMRDIWGDFNGRMANTFLVNLNELSKKDTIQCQGKIKGLITDGKITINNKGMNQYDIQSFHRFIITTNNEDPIVTKKDDRRNLIIKCSDELKGNTEYFKKFYGFLNDINVVKTFYEYLKTLDVANFADIPIPQTQHQNEMKEMNMDIEERWIRDMVSSKDEDFEMSGIDNYSSFLKYCDENGVEYKTNAIKLGMKIKRLVGDCVEKKHTKKGDLILFCVDKIKKKLNIECLINL